jgi:hypothetical protein
MKRTDQHRPSAINPSEYEFVSMEYIKIGESGDIMGDCMYLQECRRTIAAHIARTGGAYANHEHGGSCMVCGADAIYTALFYHEPTNTYVRTGQDCADKMGHGDLDWNAFRTSLRDATELRAGKRKAQAVLAESGHSAAWCIYTAGPDAGFRFGDAELRPYTPPDRDFAPCTAWLHANGEPLTGEEMSAMDKARFAWHFAHKEEATIQDIVGRLVKYGSISEKAMSYIGMLLHRIDTRAERQAQREAERALAADCPEGRIVITGTVLTVKVDDGGQWGPTTKILLQADAGWKVWGSRPASGGPESKCAERGDRIEFKATVERSKDDPKFGFYKRPTNGRVLATAVAA